MQHMGEDTLLLLITGNSYFFSIKSPLCCQSGEEIKTCCFTCTPFGRGRKSRGFSQQLHSDLWCPMTILSLSLRPLVRLEPLLTPLHVHVSHVSTRVNPHARVARPGLLRVFTPPSGEIDGGRSQLSTHSGGSLEFNRG